MLMTFLLKKSDNIEVHLLSLVRKVHTETEVLRRISPYLRI